MSTDDSSSIDPDREDRLLGIIRAYTNAVEAGEKPDRRAILKRHPDLAADLSACLGGLTFLDAAAGPLAATAHDLVDPTAAGPQTLGDYLLIREIGRGGMGVVYEAEQLSLGRKVAVKVLPMAAALDSRQLQRFRNEAQAAAQLHHTHIVPVYAVGCERSIHYYAMQLIEGQSLADVIRQMRADEASGTTPSGSDDLTTLRLAKRQAFYRTVVRLGLQAADALHHAHHAGIVHRDIKPANLLLDSAADVWITDFGLAQFYAEENNLTQTSDRPGTLRYMSPEQAAGRAVVLDQRTDIYSLGVTLYELLTLHPAVPGDTREQLMHRLQNEEPRPARAIDPAIPKELETILATAASREPADRYPTAGALAEDLRRFLDDQPILARPPSLLARSFKWVRRHRTVAASAVVAGVILLAGFAVSTVLIAREQAKTRAAYFNEKDRSAEAESQKRRAERAFGEAREAVDFFANVAATELADDRPNPEARRAMLEAAVDYYEAFLRERQNDPAVRRELAEAKSTVAGLLAELSGVEDAYRVRTLLRIAADPAVATDLRLNAEQSTKVAALLDDASAAVAAGGPRGNFGGGNRPGEGFGDRFDNGFRNGFGNGVDNRSNNAPGSGPGDGPPGGRGAGPEWMRQRLVRAAARTLAGLNAVLAPVQFDRLRQIARQARGPTAFADPDVVKALALTLPQKEAVRSILSATRAAARRPAPPPPRPESDAFNRFDPDPPDPARLARDAALRSLVDLLDPPQRSAWRLLVGRPFPEAARLDPDLLRRPRGGFGGPPDAGLGNGPTGDGPPTDRGP